MREEEMIIVIGGMITAVVLVKIIAGNVARIVCHWCDSSLKLRLVEAGMSAKEIEQVVSATKRRRKALPAKCVKPTSDEYSYVP